MKEKNRSLWKALAYLLEKYFVYFFAIGIIALNVSLVFDNVVWGDEAFSLNTVRDTNIAGIFQRVYYWDNHPPLYYLWLKLFVTIFGSEIWVGHLASVTAFTLTVVFILIAWKKKIGTWPVLFFIAMLGLSETCVEYNVEIRMYALVFLEISACLYFGYRILTEETGVRDWVILVIIGALAAYSHYYGFMTSGVLLAVVSLLYFIQKRGKTWIYGVCSIVGYLVLYSPWLFVLLKQMKGVKNDWWMTAPEKVDVILEFMFLGHRLKPILLPLLIVLSLLVLLLDSGLIEIRNSTETAIVFHKRFSLKNASKQLIGLGFCWMLLLIMLAVPYVISYLFTPILARRYMYALVPVVLMIFMLCVSHFVDYGSKIVKKKTINCLCVLLFVAVLIPGLLDFKLFRSITRTQDYQIQRIFTEIGEPEEDTIFIAQNVKHLAWTVLQYYYPENYVGWDNLFEVLDQREIWAFYPEPIEGVLEYMEENGFESQCYPEMYFGKYPCTMYHFERTE